MKFAYTLLLTVISIGSFSQTKDESAIREVLEKESKTWRAGDIQGHADCWSIRPYSRIIISTIEGNVIDLPPDMMINPPAHLVGKGGYSSNSNYKMNINGNNAWVTHDEESVAPDGTKSYTFEFRILEKINNEWKLVAQSIHAYKPE